MHEHAALLTALAELCEATRGVDWDAERAQRALDVILATSRVVPGESLDAGLQVLVERLDASHVGDADGVAHVAITGGTLVERGAAAAPLGQVLLRKLPAVLSAARSYADLCLGSPLSRGLPRR